VAKSQATTTPLTPLGLNQKFWPAPLRRIRVSSGGARRSPIVNPYKRDAPFTKHVIGARAVARHPTAVIRHPTAWCPGTPPTRAQIEELESVCYWIRQLIALVCGLACGSTHGASAFVLFGSLHIVLGAGVLRSSAATNDATTERRWALVQEGLTASVGTFLVTWTLAHCG
jgi:hypothetical protein